MMASIPNMRSTPLPLPNAKVPASEAAPGDFALQLPVAAAPAQPIPTVPVPPAAPDAPDGIVADLVQTAGTEKDSAKDDADAKITTESDETADPCAMPIPLVQVQPASAPAPSSTPAPSASAPTVVAPAANRFPASVTPAPIPVATNRGTACGQDGGKAGLPMPDEAAAEAEPIEAPEVEAAVKALLQRKAVPARQGAAAPKPADAKSNPAPAPAQPRREATAATNISAMPIAAQATLPVAAEPVQPPVLAPDLAKPAPIRSDDVSLVEAARTTDLAIERKLDLSRDSAWLDRLARDIATAGAGDEPLRFRLHPQTLGHLQVELQQSDRGTAVRLTVETEGARRILTDAQPRLAAEARAQGVRIAETHVDLSGSGRQAPGDQRRQDDARQTPIIRTAPQAGRDASASGRPARRAGLDRYA